MKSGSVSSSCFRIGAQHLPDLMFTRWLFMTRSEITFGVGTALAPGAMQPAPTLMDSSLATCPLPTLAIPNDSAFAAALDLRNRVLSSLSGPHAQHLAALSDNRYATLLTKLGETDPQVLAASLMLDCVQACPTSVCNIFGTVALEKKGGPRSALDLLAARTRALKAIESGFGYKCCSLIEENLKPHFNLILGALLAEDCLSAATRSLPYQMRLNTLNEISKIWRANAADANSAISKPSWLIKICAAARSDGYLAGAYLNRNFDDVVDEFKYSKSAAVRTETAAWLRGALCLGKIISNIHTQPAVISRLTIADTISQIRLGYQLGRSQPYRTRALSLLVDELTCSLACGPKLLPPQFDKALLSFLRSLQSRERESAFGSPRVERRSDKTPHNESIS